MKNKILICLCAVCLLTPGQVINAQAKASVSGKVLDAGSGEALIGVNIFAGRKTGTASGMDGMFSLSLDTGRHFIEFSYVGYASRQQEIYLGEGEMIQLVIEMTESSNILEEVVVSAGKYEQNISEVTVSMEVIKPAVLEHQNITSLDMILEKTPGISILDGQASIRGGSGFSYGAGSRVMMLVDDLPMISADAGDVKWDYLPVESLNQVEVIKGASSVLYGSSALNGVINLRTRFPGIEPRTELTLLGGVTMNPSRRELIWWNGQPLSGGFSFSHLRKIGRLDLSVAGNYFKDEGYREGDYQNRLRGNLGLRYSSKKIQGLAMGLNMSAMYVDKSDFLLWRDAHSGAFLQPPASLTPFTGYRYNLDPYVEYSTRNGNRHSLKTRLYGVDNSTENDDRSSASRLWYAEYRYMKRYRSNTRWTSGLSLSRNRVNSSLYDDHAGSNFALYSQLDAKIWKKMQLSSGVRWESNTLNGEFFYSLPVFRAGLNYQPWKSTFLRASLGQGFRFPSVAEKFTDTSIGGLKIFPNPELDPERGWSTELGIRQGFSLGSFAGFADLALFWTEYHDMIEFTFGVYPPNPDDVPTFDDVGFKALNIGRARISGMDLGLSLNGKAGPLELLFSGGYTYMIPVDPTLLDSVEVVAVDGQILKYRRRHLLKVDLEAGFWKMFAGINFQYNSRMINVDEVFLDPLTGNLLLPGFPGYWMEHGRGYTLADFRLGWNITEWIRVTAILNNAFNVEYLGRPGDIGQPRNLGLQVRLVF